MLKTRFFSTALLAVWLAGTAYADISDNELDYGSSKDIRDLNPHLYGGEIAAQNMLFESLVVNTEQGIQPQLAESWTISADGKTYRFKLRQGVHFSDGEPFNAQAVKLNMDAVIANYNRHAWLDLVREIDAVNALDENTLELKLKHPYYPTLIELGLTRPFRFISPKCFINGDTANGVSCYNGTGPWILTEHNKNADARFIRNPDYWGKRPALNAVRWHVIPDRQTLLLALRKGDIQLIFGADGDMLNMDSFNALSHSGKFTGLLSGPVASRTMLLNSQRPIIQDRQVRQALQHAVDKKAIAEGIFNGVETVAETLLAKNVPYADVEQQTYHFDPQKSVAMLEAAGWKLPAGATVREKNGSRFSLLLSYNVSNAVEKDIAELLQADFAKIGVELHLLGEEKQAFLARQQRGDFDLQYSLSWGKPYDPASFVSSFRIPAHGDYQAQKGLSEKAEIDRMIDEVLITQDESRRRALYAKLLQTLATEAVYLPLTYARTKALFVPQLRGVGFNPSQYEIPFERMFFQP